MENQDSESWVAYHISLRKSRIKLQIKYPYDLKQYILYVTKVNIKKHKFN